MVAVHVDAVLDSEPVAGPRPEVAERRESEHRAALVGHQRGIAGFPPGAPPRQAIVQRRGRVTIYRGRGGDHLVVDFQDSGEVALLRIAYGHSSIAPHLVSTRYHSSIRD